VPRACHAGCLRTPRAKRSRGPYFAGPSSRNRLLTLGATSTRPVFPAPAPNRQSPIDNRQFPHSPRPVCHAACWRIAPNRQSPTVNRQCPPPSAHRVPSAPSLACADASPTSPRSALPRHSSATADRRRVGALPPSHHSMRSAPKDTEERGLQVPVAALRSSVAPLRNRHFKAASHHHAPRATYGGPAGLPTLRACHASCLPPAARSAPGPPLQQCAAFGVTSTLRSRASCSPPQAAPKTPHRCSAFTDAPLHSELSVNVPAPGFAGSPLRGAVHGSRACGAANSLFRSAGARCQPDASTPQPSVIALRPAPQAHRTLRPDCDGVFAADAVRPALSRIALPRRSRLHPSVLTRRPRRRFKRPVVVRASTPPFTPWRPPRRLPALSLVEGRRRGAARS
jgi:hypothetical protein